MKQEKKNTLSLEGNQSFWTLGSISGISLGIPGMLIGDQLARTYGVLSAITSICIGNLIIWILGLAIFSMTHGKNHAIENVKTYFGKWSGILTILIFALAFLIWYTRQLTGTSTTLTNLFQFHEEWKIGIVLGLFVSLLAIGGFKMVKWVCLIGSPILAIIGIYSIIIYADTIQYVGKFQFSYVSVLLVAIILLPGTLNLPTFLRHSRSKADSILALSVMMIFHSSFQILTIFSGIDEFSINIGSQVEEGLKIANILTTALFSFLSFICINLTNIYFVSACWEMIFPYDYGSKKYLIFGLIGTSAYAYLSITGMLSNIDVAETVVNYSMSTLIISLSINFLMSVVVKHRSRFVEQCLGSISWIIGWSVSVISFINNMNDPIQALIYGSVAILLFSISTVFIAEAIWSIKNIRQKAL